MSDFELDEDFYKMSKEELLEDIKYRIQADREMIILNFKEKKVLRQENRELKDALIHGTQVVENAAKKMNEYDAIIKNGTKTILMWKYSCYALSMLYVFLAIYVSSN